MDAKEVNDLIKLVKSMVKNLATELLDNKDTANLKDYTFDRDLKKEIKSTADNLLDEKIISILKPLGYTVLTEESGLIIAKSQSNYWFIIDPLDGTYNYIRGSGPSAISIALWKGNEPIFGVIYNLINSQLFWGGKNFGSYCDDQKISVSNASKIAESVLFTGFPVRFNFDEKNSKSLINYIKEFAKVRMIGSAAISLINVANGSADLYYEKNIMLWDVAAGIAIVEGAGGKVTISNKQEEYCLDVVASNEYLHKVSKI
jgi:myo-inositol-1(or 4)-monophosphatase